MTESCEPKSAPGCGCAPDVSPDQMTAVYRRILWIVLAINITMFGVEVVAGLLARSVSLQADALDFFGDALTYAITLMVLGMGLRWRAGAALFKGLSMGAFGLWVVGLTVWHALNPGVPGAEIMGGIALLALTANVTSAALLFKHRMGDSNMRSVWLCSRNDAIANMAVLVAALGVWGSGTGWPDLIVGFGIAALNLHSAVDVTRHAVADWRAAR